MSIGESLAEARRQAGLSVTQVSQRTRVREPIIRGIERDDFSACGGDFYARGHIRSIARAVGADAGPLVREYDATVRSHEEVTAADLFRPVTPMTAHEPPRRPWMAALGLLLVVVIGVGAYYLVSATRHASAASPAAAVGAGSATRHHARHGAGRSSQQPAGPVQPYAHQVVVQLAAIEDCWVEFTTPAGGYLTQSVVTAGTSKSWSFGYPVHMRLGNPGGISLVVDGKNPLPPGTSNPITLSLGLNDAVSAGA
jgi:cytoskeletal protein RodZ